jgi:hypothetical protein
MRNCLITAIEEFLTGNVSKSVDEARENNTEPPLIEDVVSDKIYYISVVCLQIALTLTSCLVHDLTLIFGIAATFSEIVTNNILPGMYLAYTAYKLSPSDAEGFTQNKTEKSYRRLVLEIVIGSLYAIFGVFYCVYSIY